MDGNTDYAVRLSYDIDNQEYSMNDKSKLVFSSRYQKCNSKNRKW
jgi:hypothetical protein